MSLQLYKSIDHFFAAGLGKAGKEVAQSFIGENSDARDYFFSTAPITWVEWLNKEGFFKVLNQPAVDKILSYRIPELRYLLRVVTEGGDQQEVVKIMNEVKCDKNFNPEVVDQFLWIAQKLTAEHLTQITPKIQRENWVLLMKDYNQSAFSYQELVKKLSDAKAHDSLIQLADALLTVNPEKPQEDEIFSLTKNFYIGDIHESGIFEALACLKGEDAEKGITLISKVLSKLTYSKKEEEGGHFDVSEKFYINDLDFFDLKPDDHSRLSYKEDERSLLKTYAILIQEVMLTCQQSSREIFDTQINSLPNSQTLWRIKLFTMSRCPEFFAEEIKMELNRLFDDVKKYRHLFYGTEYLNTLKIAYKKWEKEELASYARKVLAKFEKLTANSEDNWRKKCGWEILSCVASELDEKIKGEAATLFGKALDPAFKPRLPEREMSSGRIDDRSPVTFNEPEYKDVRKVITDLKNEFTPKKLKEKYKGGDFTPINVEGVANALRGNTKERMADYLLFAEHFLDPAIHLHYTYSFLRVIEEHLRDKKKIDEAGWLSLFELFTKIRRSEVREPEYSEDDRWLARWDWIEKAVADILLFLLERENEGIFKAKRNEILDLISHLLNNADPKPEDEKNENMGLFHVAINSVRGRAFQAFVNFAYLDGEVLKKDVIKLYQETIAVATPSVRFVIGHYLATFYYRDKKEVAKQFSVIFPKEAGREYDFFAAWDGYLTNSLYRELFDELQDCYTYALNADTSIYKGRKRNDDDEESDVERKIAIHLALAFAHFDEVQFNEKKKHPLLECMWNKGSLKAQKEFVSFLGRHFISNPANAQKIDLEKLKNFWDFLLSAKDINPAVYAEFGFWINYEKEVIEDPWLIEKIEKTLQKSNGHFSWDHGLWKRMSRFAEIDAKKTLLILQKNLIDDLLGDVSKRWFYLDEEKISIFKILYASDESAETKDLINRLLEKGGRTFWPLKDIVDR